MFGGQWRWIVALVSLLAFLCVVPAASAATTLKVNTPSDPDNTTGSCSTGGSCSLREAINQANADASGDTVTVPPGEYDLSLGALTISADMSLIGTSARKTVIKQTVPGQRVVLINSGTVTIQGVTVTGGHLIGSGGGIGNQGALTLKDSQVVNNESDGSSMPPTTGSGGGIASLNGSGLTIINSTIANNTAASGTGTGAEGGGIFSEASVLVINSTIASNAASGGTGSGRGGGVFLASDGTSNPYLGLANATVAFNAATGGSSLGGNIDLNQGAGTTTGFARDSIIADGTASSFGNCAENTLKSDGYNLEDHNQCQLTGPGDKTSTPAKLSQLGNHGGPTDTVALLPRSPAINAGNPQGCTDPSSIPLTTDQRGIPRPQGPRCDIGAFEFSVPSFLHGPAVTGRPQVGQTLTCAFRLNSPDQTPKTRLTWLRGAAPVGTGIHYLVKPADAGHALRCAVAASTAAGKSSRTSTPRAIPLVPSASITSASVTGHQARFSFTTKHASGALCALAKSGAKPHYSACRSPKTYSNLAKGSYTFYVRATGPGGISAPAEHAIGVS